MIDRLREAVARLQRTNDVHMDVVEAPVRSKKLSRLKFDVGQYLTLLAVRAVSRPCSNVAVQVGPDIPLSDNAVCDLRIRVRWIMEEVENLLPESYWNIGPNRFT